MALSRREFYSRVGLMHDVDQLTTSAYNFVANKRQLAPDIGADHEDPWFISFHGSQFPGDNPRACPRKALYRMMDIPRPIAPRWLEQVADAGKDIENRIVQKWHDAGYLLSAPPTETFQTAYEDAEHWLTSTVDAQILFPMSNQGRVVEVKSKYAADIDQMFQLYRGPDPAHIFQVKCQIGLSYEQGPRTATRCYNTGRLAIKIGHRNNKPVIVCPEHMTAKCLREEVLAPIKAGTIYYVSRDHPADTWEFYFDYDPAFMAAGRKQLAMWRAWFEEGVLPQTKLEDKRFSHPFGWTWTRSQKDPLSPCEYCDYGDVCREDHKRAVAEKKPIKLSDSVAVEVAREVRPDYDFERIRDAVFTRWNRDRDKIAAGD